MKLVPEWEDHSHCLIAWPCNQELYGPVIEKARFEIANLANQIADEEKVIIYCNKDDYDDCKKLVANSRVEIHLIGLDDSWMRDIAPIFYKEKNKLQSISFEFNGYGKYPNFKNDNKISDYISNQLSIPSTKIELILEGGGITYDEKGNLFTTESVLLNQNRNNPSKDKITDILISLFELKSVIWFEQGLFNDDTDGHIDNILCPIGNNHYLLASSKDQSSPNYKVLLEIKKKLLEEFSKKNTKITITEIPLPSECSIEGKKLVSSYINFYFTKNKIFLPKFGVREDLEVLDLFKSLFKEKQIVMLDTKNINYGGGNIHCVTMNVPKL